jgi:hypothetical protein
LRPNPDFELFTVSENLKCPIRRRRLYGILDAYIMYPSGGRASPCPKDDGLNRRRFAMNAGFHRAIPAIAHPAGKAQSRRLAGKGSAIADTLHSSFYHQPLSHRQSRFIELKYISRVHIEGT